MPHKDPEKGKAYQRAYNKRRRRPAGYKEAKEARRILLAYGITQEQYDEMVTRQKGVCAVCGHADAKRALSVDHDHETGRVRGLLCSGCNAAIGRLGDNVAGLRRALAYLEEN